LEEGHAGQEAETQEQEQKLWEPVGLLATPGRAHIVQHAMLSGKAPCHHNQSAMSNLSERSAGCTIIIPEHLETIVKSLEPKVLRVLTYMQTACSNRLAQDIHVTT
jgi:hypothetical protein